VEKNSKKGRKKKGWKKGISPKNCGPFHPIAEAVTLSKLENMVLETKTSKVKREQTTGGEELGRIRGMRNKC